MLKTTRYYSTVRKKIKKNSIYSIIPQYNFISKNFQIQGGCI